MGNRFLVPTVNPSGMTLLSTTNASSSASIAFTSIPGNYRSLRLIIRQLEPVSNNTDMYLRFNNDSSASNYYNRSSADSDGTFNFNSSRIDVMVSHSFGASKTLSVIDIPDYANTSTYKTAITDSVFIGFGTNGGQRRQTGYYNQTGAITQLNIQMSTQNILLGTFQLYGVN
jgi:hypothetical protein